MIIRPNRMIIYAEKYADIGINVSLLRSWEIAVEVAVIETMLVAITFYLNIYA